MLILIVSSGPDKGRVFTLRDGDRATIGRGGDPIQLHDHKASRHHCDLWHEDGTWWVRDADSRHGTHVNQHRIDGRASLDDGDFVQVGRTVLVLAETNDTAPGAEAPAAVAARVVEDAAPAAKLERAAEPLHGLADADDPQPPWIEAESRDERRAVVAAAAAASAAPPRRSRSAVFVGALTVVALAVIALNAVVLWHSQQAAAPAAHGGLSADAFHDGLAEHRRHLDASTQAIAQRLDAIPTAERQEQLLADALSGQADALASRLADVEPTLARIETQLAERSLDPAWRSELTGLLERQLAATTGLAAWSETMDDKLAGLAARPPFEVHAERLAEAVAASLPATALGDAEVRQTLAAIRDDLAAMRGPATAPDADELVRRVREAALAEAAAQTEALRGLLHRLDARDDLALQLTQLTELVGKQPELLETRLTELLAEHAAGDKLDRVIEALAASHDRPGNDAASDVLASIDRRLAALADRPGPDRLAAAVEAVRDAFARRDDSVLPAIESLAEALERRPSREEIQAAFGEVRDGLIASQDERLAALVEKLEAGQTPDREAIAEAVRLTLAEQAATLRPLLDAIASRVADHPSREQLDAALAEARQTMSRDVATRFDALLAAIEARPDADAVGPLIESALAARPGATAEALERLAEAVAAQPTREEIASLIAATRAATRGDVRDALAGVVDGLKEAKAADARLADAASRAEAHLDRTQQTLAALLAEVRDREAIAGLSEQVAALAEAEPADAARVDDVLAAIEAKGAATDRLLAAAEGLEAWPDETRGVFERTLAAVETRLAELKDASIRPSGAVEAEALAGVLEGIRRQAQVGLEGLRSPSASPGGAAMAASPPLPPATVSASPLPPSAGGVAASVVAPRPAASVPSQLGPDDQLTKLEMAYKLAFETGKPVTVGKAVIDPVTGELTPGRVIDPTAARAAGITRWRDWYVMDDFAERRRLQRLADEVRRGRTGEPDLYTLPE